MGQLDTIQSEQETHDPCEQPLVLTGAQGNRECHWIAPVLLAAVQPGPWLRPAVFYSSYRTRQTGQRDKATGQPRQTKKQTNSRTSQPLKKIRESSNGVQRGVPDHPRANTSVQERKAPEQHAFFFRPTPLGFRQVVPHVQLHVCIEPVN